MALEYLKIRVHALRQGLVSRLKEYVSDFPTGTPILVIDLLQQILKKIEPRIDSATDERILSLIGRTIRTYGGYLEHFDNAHTEQTPRALAQLLEDLCKTLQFGEKLVVWPQAAYNYSIQNILPDIKCPLVHLLSPEEQKDLFKEFTAINLVSFPRIERDNILLHAIFGHELGHPIADSFLDIEKVPEKVPGDQVFLTYKNTILMKPVVTPSKNPRVFGVIQ